MIGLRWIIACVSSVAVQAQVPAENNLPVDLHEAPSESIVDAAEVVVAHGSFAQVDSGVYRGPRPTPALLDFLKKKGIKTVINLQGPILRWVGEKSEVEARGMRYLSRPISALPVWQVDERDVRRTLEIMADPENQPVYVHCLYGNDRTGFVIGLYRIAYSGWTHEAAFAEMKKYSYHHRRYTIFTHYFRDFTGFDGI